MALIFFSILCFHFIRRGLFKQVHKKQLRNVINTYQSIKVNAPNQILRVIVIDNALIQTFDCVIETDQEITTKILLF